MESKTDEKERERQLSREYYEKNKERKSEYYKKYYEQNREKVLERAKKYQMEKNGGPKKRGRPSKYGIKKVEPAENI